MLENTLSIEYTESYYIYLLSRWSYDVEKLISLYGLYGMYMMCSDFVSL